MNRNGAPATIPNRAQDQIDLDAAIHLVGGILGSEMTQLMSVDGGWQVVVTVPLAAGSRFELVLAAFHFWSGAPRNATCGAHQLPVESVQIDGVAVVYRRDMEELH